MFDLTRVDCIFTNWAFIISYLLVKLNPTFFLYNIIIGQNITDGPSVIFGNSMKLESSVYKYTTRNLLYAKWGSKIWRFELQVRI